ncbi:cytochrome b/b6 domain-containing protein [Pandoraea terrae]|uniref:cytochrome b/b6 domain-containing protein n=1 Tax=Pandoraea terrae TaxID=1537710 RepID=UPI00123FBAF8|nr:cytochrome b/b6 domain-containing protein [Pandoraea terrae]
MKKIRIWDLPTRLFHWGFVTLAILAFVTAKIGGNAMVYHFWCGYAILALLIFRFVWGLFGPRYARFSAFIAGPRTFIAWMRNPDAEARRFAGHTPLGGLSVIAMLVLFAAQAMLGLFSNDDIFNDGPLVKFISKDTSDALTGWHLLNQWVLIGLVSLHVLAILYYRFSKKKDLIRPMIVGDKHAAHPHAAPARDDWRVRLSAFVLLAISAAAVYEIVHLVPTASF